MAHSEKKQRIITHWITPLFVGAAFIVLYLKLPISPGILWTGLLLPERIAGHREPTAETSLLFLLYLLMRLVGYTDPFLLFLPLMIALLIWASWQTRHRFIQPILLALAIIWFSRSNLSLIHSPGIVGWLLWGLVATAGILHWITFFQKTTPGIKQLDILLCSFSGHTAHYTEHFITGAKQQGTRCVTHRFHYADTFQPMLTGDGLAVAFPVICWKPPWTLIAYLWKKLPAGAGKPAFILYTSMGGPDNAGIVVWLLLTLKGYRVRGRHWAFYPNNVPTLRLGFNAVWKWLDRLVPFQKTLEAVQHAGAEFVCGNRAGHPLILWPSPFTFAGMLLDNRWIDIALYRNYVRKKRCIQCGLCVRHCPTQRLFIHKGFPKAKGTCVLCLGCVNLCPQRAMQLAAWTEYGHAYHSRWPEFIVKNHQDALLKSKEDN